MPNWNLNHHESGVARVLRYSLKICCYFSRQTLSLHLKMFSIHLEAGLCIVILIAQILWKRCLVSFPKVDEAFCWNTDAGILIQVTSNVSPVESPQLIRTNPSMAKKKWTVKKKSDKTWKLHHFWNHGNPQTKYTPQNKHGTWKWTLGKGDSYWKPSFPGSMLIFWGVDSFFRQPNLLCGFHGRPRFRKNQNHVPRTNVGAAQDSCEQMDVSKNRGKTPKMDGLFHGKPYVQMDDLGVFPWFLETPKWNWMYPQGNQETYPTFHGVPNGGFPIIDSWVEFAWLVLSDEQMRKRWPFSLLNNEQMSNWLGVEHFPVAIYQVYMRHLRLTHELQPRGACLPCLYGCRGISTWESYLQPSSS